MDPGRASLALVRPDGTEKRLGGDEPNAENIPKGLGWGMTLPGGYADLSFDLSRDPGIDYGDTSLFDEVHVYGAGNDKLYEGYDVAFPGSDDNSSSSVNAMGFQGKLKDNPVFSEIFLDADQGRVTPPGTARRIYLIANNYCLFDPGNEVDPTSGKPSIKLQWEGTLAAGIDPHSEGWYDAGNGNKIAQVFFLLKIPASTTGYPIYSDGSAEAEVVGFDDDVNLNPIQSGNIRSAESWDRYMLSAARRFIALKWRYANSGVCGQDGEQYSAYIQSLVFIGDHGLPLINASTTFAGGVLASDVVAYVLKSVAPEINFTTGPSGSIQPSGFPIPHIIFPEAVTAADAILQAGKFDVPDWGIYNDREFFWRAPGSGGRLWVTRKADRGVSFKDEGVQADDVYNGVVVQFTDPSGIVRKVGPPGTPGMDQTDPSLHDYSETNPLNERGAIRLGQLNVNTTTTIAGGIQLGARWLEDILAVTDRGTAEVTGIIFDEFGTPEPVSKVRSGDRIRFDDVDGRERRIIETRYGHEDRKNLLTLDSTPHRVDAIMEQMNVELVALGAAA